MSPIQIAPPENPNLYRALSLQALRIARDEIGNGEQGRNNDGPHVRRYRGGKGGRGSWCSYFVGYCFDTACCKRGLFPLWPHTGGAKKLVRQVAELGDWVADSDRPLPGDVIAWHRGWPISWRGHVAIVDRYDSATDTLVAVEGNAGKFPALVKEVPYPAGKWRRRLFGIARLA